MCATAGSTSSSAMTLALRDAWTSSIRDSSTSRSSMMSSPRSTANGSSPDVHLGSQHSVSEALRVALAHVVHLGELAREVDLLQAGDVALRAAAGSRARRRGRSGSRGPLLLRPVIMSTSVRPAATASSTTYWMAGLSTTGSISLGIALVAGRNRVPIPAAGITALVDGEGHSRHTGTDGMVRSRPPDDIPLPHGPVRRRARSQARAGRAELRQRRRNTPQHGARARPTPTSRANLIRLTEDLHARSIAAYLSTARRARHPAVPALGVRAGHPRAAPGLPRGRPAGLGALRRRRGDGRHHRDADAHQASCSARSRSTRSTSSWCRRRPSTAAGCGWAGAAATSTRPSGSMEACPPVYAVIFDHELVDAVPRATRPAGRRCVTLSGIVALKP